MTEASSGGEDEWADVEPIPQDDGPRPAVAIAYSRDFSHAMGLLRAALQRNELSHRSLRLTERVIAMNAANYTAWHFRRLCVQSLGASLDAELDWLDDMAELHAKNYQVWPDCLARTTSFCLLAGGWRVEGLPGSDGRLRADCAVSASPCLWP